MTIRYHLDAHAKAGRLPELEAELARLDEDTATAMATGRRYLPGMMAVVNDSKAEAKAKARLERALRVAIAANQPATAVLLAKHPRMDFRHLSDLWQGMTHDKTSSEVAWATFDALTEVIAKTPPTPALRALLPKILDLPRTPAQYGTLRAHATPAMAYVYNRLSLASELMAIGEIAWADTVLDSLTQKALSDGYGQLMEGTRRHPAARAWAPQIIARLDWSHIGQQKHTSVLSHLQTTLGNHPLEDTWAPVLLAQLSGDEQIQQAQTQNPHALAALDRAHAVVAPRVRQAWLAEFGANRFPQTQAWQQSQTRLARLADRPATEPSPSRPRRRP